MENKHSHLSGILTGLTSSILFNPIDRALYLHIKNHTNFLHRSNWKNPYQGMNNALFNRIIQHGYYYTLVDKFNQLTLYYLDTWNETQRKITVGTLVGCTTAIILNPISCIKYHTWRNDSYQLRKTALHMYKKNGISAFLRGMGTTALRDTSFSLGYLFLTCKSDLFSDLSPVTSFLWNCSSLTFVTLATSPLNYARNIKFATPISKPSLSYYKIYLQFLQEYDNSLKKNKNLSYIRYMAYRFCWGWGTMRVSIGMSLGKLIYDKYSYVLNQHF